MEMMLAQIRDCCACNIDTNTSTPCSDWWKMNHGNITVETTTMSNTSNTKFPVEHSGALDINEAFRSGGRSPEHLDQINKACIVMLSEAGIVPRATAARIARGIAAVIEQMRASGTPRRSADYLDYEPRLTAVVGADASRLHSGRSRQDLASAMARMNLRDGLLQEIDALICAREKTLALATQHTETIIPAYTHGVQAQPTTFAHYLLALAAALARETQRLREAYARINLNPLGAAALARRTVCAD